MKISVLTLLVFLVCSSSLPAQENKDNDLKKKYAEFTGDWKINPEGRGEIYIAIYVKDGTLWFFPETSSIAGQLLPVKGNELEFTTDVSKGPLYEIKFISDEAGAITKFRLIYKNGNLDLTAEKVGIEQKKLYTEIAGEYELEVTPLKKIVVKIYIEKDKLHMRYEGDEIPDILIPVDNKQLEFKIESQKSGIWNVYFSKSENEKITKFRLVNESSEQDLTGIKKGEIFQILPLKKELSDIFPGEHWERYENPESAGFSKEKLDQAREYLKSYATTGMIVVVDGRILFEYGDVEELFYVASVRKSVLAMLFGKYVGNGTIDLNKSLTELNIDDVGGLTDQEKEATVTDLLSARSGVYHPASNEGDNLADAPERGSKKHGEYFLYSNWDFNCLGTIFEQETGKNLYDALEEDITVPIGMRDFNRSTHKRTGDQEKSIHLAYHMEFSTRDMARLGHLMLHKGKWKDKQLIPEDWTEKISNVVTPTEEMNPADYRNSGLGYGYLWWIFDGPKTKWPFRGGYTAWGFGGQFITVLPELNMVIAHKTNFEKNNQKYVEMLPYLRILDKIIRAANVDPADSDEHK